LARSLKVGECKDCNSQITYLCCRTWKRESALSPQHRDELRWQCRLSSEKTVIRKKKLRKWRKRCSEPFLFLAAHEIDVAHMSKHLCLKYLWPTSLRYERGILLLLLLLGAELPLVVESFDLLNNIFPFPSILDAGYPVFNLHLANTLFDVNLP